jgi:hypothetical protein
LSAPPWRKYFIAGLFVLAVIIGAVGTVFSVDAGAAALGGAVAVAVNFVVLVWLGGYFLAASGRKKIRVGLLFLLHLCIVPAALIAIFILAPAVAVPAVMGAVGEATAGPLLLAVVSFGYK